MKKIPVCPNCHIPITEDNLRVRVPAVVVYDVFYRDGELSYSYVDYYENFDGIEFYCLNCDELLPYSENEIKKILGKVKLKKEKEGAGK
jgi:hypothetical protein